MTKRQKLQLEQSEKRQKINELLGLDELSDEQRSELDTLTKRMQHIEVEMRAAIVVEGEEEAETRGMFGNNGDGEPAELRQLLCSVTLGDYLNPAAAGAGLEGRARELNEALKVPLVGKGGGIAVPWQALEIRAFTTSTQNDGSELQRPVLQRLFGPGVMDALGVRMDSACRWAARSGRLSAGGVAPAQAKEERVAAAAAVAGHVQLWRT